MEPALHIERLDKLHPTGSRPFLFSGITARIDCQDTIAVTGSSGQGKTTLLRVLARLERMDGGSLTLHGKPAANWPPTVWRKRVCYVPQAPVMLPSTIEDNLSAVSKLHQSPFERQLAERLMESVGLTQIDWKKKASDLSGGEKQRLQLVRSLMLRPDILLLDEVTSALDAQSKRLVERLLAEWNRTEGTALVWITHDAEQARIVSRRRWFMADGGLVEQNEPELEGSRR